MLFPLALTPMSLEFLGQMFMEARLRREIRYNLQMERSFGSVLAGPNSAASGSLIPFRLIVAEGATQVVMRAVHTAGGAGDEATSLIGCLDQASGEIQVQERFSAPPPSLCRIRSLESTATAMSF
jgi:hypothetical protein